MQTKPVPAAFGWLGIEPTWARGGKDRVGTAYTASTLIWFSFWNGIITEVYYPTVDRLQLRDLQYLITDGNILFHEGSVISNLNSSGYASIRISGTSISCAPACPLLLRFTWIDVMSDGK
jgi:Glucodextranase, domain N